MSDATCDTVHCPECHEAPLLRRRLATAEVLLRRVLAGEEDDTEGCDAWDRWSKDARAFLAPTEPDGASGNRQGDDK